jgi:hypothetical protein
VLEVRTPVGRVAELVYSYEIKLNLSGDLMLYRPQRGGFLESMTAAVILEPTYAALASYLNVNEEDLDVNFYCYDTRLVWRETHLVTIGGQAEGFINRRPDRRPDRRPNA